jgi:hypothetical protein
VATHVRHRRNLVRALFSVWCVRLDFCYYLVPCSAADQALAILALLRMIRVPPPSADVTSRGAETGSNDNDSQGPPFRSVYEQQTRKLISVCWLQPFWYIPYVHSPQETKESLLDDFKFRNPDDSVEYVGKVEQQLVKMKFFPCSFSKGSCRHGT